MQITAQMVKDLRARTSAGVMDCRAALEKTEGDIDKAIELLREQGLASAEKKAGRETREGVIGNYVHTGSRVAALVEVDCETDFVARTDEFQQLSRDLAMQIVAARPVYVKPDDIPSDETEAQIRKFREEAVEQGKPEAAVEQIVAGRMDKYYQEVCLLNQPFIKDESKTIDDLVKEHIATLGENIVVRQFARLEVGAD